jgi:hypothetical protein
MNRRLHTDLERWLAAEAAGDDAGAEDAFGALFAALPQLAPHPGFAERVVMELREPDSGRVPWLWKAALAAAVSLAGLTAGLLPLVRWIPIDVPRLGEIVTAAVRGVTWLGNWLGAGLDVWEILARVGNAVGVAAATPEIATAMLGSALLTAAALYTLHHLLVYERRV